MLQHCNSIRQMLARAIHICFQQNFHTIGAWNRRDSSTQITEHAEIGRSIKMAVQQIDMQ